MRLFLSGFALVLLVVGGLASPARAELCGNAIVDAGETCDDGGQLGGDGCSSRCQVEASQTREQQKCLAVLGGLTIKLADIQFRANGSCLKNAGRGKLRGDQTLAECLVVEGERKSRGIAAKLAIVQDGTPEAPGRTKCPEKPNFGYVDDVILREGVLADTRRFLEALTVAPPGEVVVDATIPENRNASVCQRLLIRGADQILRSLLREFAACQKRLLSSKSAPAVSAEDLEACFAEVRGDPRRRVGKFLDRLENVFDRKCVPDDVSIDDVLGVSSEITIEDFKISTLDDARCAACRILNTAADLRYDCDLWDDEALNGSCEEEASPSPRGAFVDGPIFARF